MVKEKRKKLNATQHRGSRWKKEWWKSESWLCDNGRQNRREDLKNKKQSSKIQQDADCDNGRLNNHVLASNQTAIWTSLPCWQRWESLNILNRLHSSITFSVCFITLHSPITRNIWLHSIGPWLLLMVIFTFNLPRLQISFREIVNLRICQKCSTREFVTEFPSSSKSLSHRPAALLPLNNILPTS